MNDIALIGKKIGMTREFYKTGQSIPVTVIKMEKARVIDVIDKEKRGYEAIQLGFGKIKNSKLTKAMKGYFAKKNTAPAILAAALVFQSPAGSPTASCMTAELSAHVHPY